MGVLLDELHKEIPLYAHVAEEGNIDVGTPDLLEKAREEARKEQELQNNHFLSNP